MSTTFLFAARHRSERRACSRVCGEHWFAAGAGLPAVDVFALAIDPQIPSMIYAASYGPASSQVPMAEPPGPR